ncbi:peptidase S8 [Oculatella sp. LEGE 06141]|uniref:S8 family peptidase n=1 Tax=Oculatella sp. LEGE 06141 TaxID=1828648 RepID=UPI00187E9529|nr:S8 family peptidase [Oculatella sp. LEGE 06141]MBE9177297.1 peptidase S8 [Oculatella sp. LEGE 06141]
MKRLLLVGLFVVGLVWALASYPGLATKGNYQSIVLDFNDRLAPDTIEQQLNLLGQQYGLDPQPNSIFSQTENLYVVEGDRQTLQALRRSDLAQYTEAIEPNYIYQIFDIPNDPDYSKQWNLRSINVESAWDETKGSGVTVAVIDTGISPVPDLKATQIVEGYDFVNDRTDASDDHGHGTHVAGTIAQATNNNYGVAGIAYEANLMPLKVLGREGGGTVADIAEAIRFAADQGADVINMSLGGGGDSDVLREAVDYAYQKGAVLVAAAGNANSNSAAFPARYPNVISVAAIDSSGAKAPYSNFGAGVDISAPGGSTGGDNVLGGILQNTIDPMTGEAVFKAFQGTSMAAPHVAGVAALVKAIGVENPDEVAAVLKQSARVIAEDELNYYGSGQLDAGAAVKLALRGKISVRDFFRWLRNNGYLNLRFWFDGGVVALMPKIAMVLGSYLLAWFLRNYLPIFSFSLGSGLVAGSSGLFFLRGLYVFDAPQFPFRILGSSIPELGSAVQGSAALNPLFASVLIPLILVALLLGHSQWRWVAIGSALGVASCLAVSAMVSPSVLWLGSGAIARTFLMANALLCFGLAYLASKTEEQSA